MRLIFSLLSIFLIVYLFGVPDPKAKVNAHSTRTYAAQSGDWTQIEELRTTMRNCESLDITPDRHYVMLKCPIEDIR